MHGIAGTTLEWTHADQYQLIEHFENLESRLARQDKIIGVLKKQVQFYSIPINWAQMIDGKYNLTGVWEPQDLQGRYDPRGIAIGLECGKIARSALKQVEEMEKSNV